MNKKLLIYQKLIGLVTVLLSALLIAMTNEGTWAVFGIPLGLYMIITKELYLFNGILEMIEEEKVGDSN